MHNNGRISSTVQIVIVSRDDQVKIAEHLISRGDSEASGVCCIGRAFTIQLKYDRLLHNARPTRTAVSSYVPSSTGSHVQEIYHGSSPAVKTCLILCLPLRQAQSSQCYKARREMSRPSSIHHTDSTSISCADHTRHMIDGI